MDNPQHKEVVPALNVEHAIGKLSEIGAPNGFEDDGETRGKGADALQDTVQILAEGKIQLRPLPGIPGLSLHNVLMCR